MAEMAKKATKAQEDSMGDHVDIHERIDAEHDRLMVDNMRHLMACSELTDAQREWLAEWWKPRAAEQRAASHALTVVSDARWRRQS